MKEIAIIYDFDGTLAKGNIPEHGILQELGINKNDFWSEVKETTKETDADEVIVYMHLLAKKAAEKSIRLTKESLNKYGKGNIPFFEGVISWFPRISNFFNNENYNINHYIVSSGLQEVIETTEISKYIKKIFASKYIYRKDGAIDSPGVAINYTTKTQYLFRINKGILNHYDNKSLNTWVPLKERPVPFSKMIYIGDGDTDIPAMKMVRAQGGISIGVFDPETWNDPSSQKRIYKLISEDRVHYVAPADYSDGSQLDIVIKGVLDRMINENS
jgi:2-hydroxy-3-keto-5-methylthiopentenyl-1-phosphate phosphatase